MKYNNNGNNHNRPVIKTAPKNIYQFLYLVELGYSLDDITASFGEEGPTIKEMIPCVYIPAIVLGAFPLLISDEAGIVEFKPRDLQSYNFSSTHADLIKNFHKRCGDAVIKSSTWYPHRLSFTREFVGGSSVSLEVVFGPWGIDRGRPLQDYISGVQVDLLAKRRDYFLCLICNNSGLVLKKVKRVLKAAKCDDSLSRVEVWGKDHLGHVYRLLQERLKSRKISGTEKSFSGVEDYY